jgi:hypothetical protein
VAAAGVNSFCVFGSLREVIVGSQLRAICTLWYCEAGVAAG